MNKNKKSILIGVISVFLISLLLLGLTYAYYRTRVIGNDSDKSISVSSKVLEITYSDKSPEINMIGLIEPGFEYKKEFTIENTGDDVVSYSVNFVDVVNTFQNYSDVKLKLTCDNCDGLNEINYPFSDMVLASNEIDVNEIHNYTLYVSYKETGGNQSDDMDKDISGRISIVDTKDINPYYSNKNTLAYNILNNSLLAKNGTYFKETPESKVGDDISKTVYKTEEREINEWTLPALGNYWLVSTIETESNVRAAVNTWATTGNASALMPYLTQNCEDTIGKEIVIAKSLTEYEYYTIKTCEMNTPIYDVETTEIVRYESELSVTSDNDGDSYYYRGNVVDNYVDFAGMCWRIVRINGDESVRLILEDKDNTCASSNGNWNYENIFYGYTKNTSNLIDIAFKNAVGTSSLVSSLKSFQTNKLSSYTSSLVAGNWCSGNTVYGDRNSSTLLNDTQLNSYLNSYKNVYFDSYNRLYKEHRNDEEASLMCNSEVYTQFSDGTAMYVGGITADEMVFAGTVLFGASNSNFYMVNDYQRESQRSFLTITPAMYTCENSLCTGKVIDFRYCNGKEVSTDPNEQGNVGYCTEELKGNLSQLPSNWHIVLISHFLILSSSLSRSSGKMYSK